ncbi:MAG TPA: ABC transporter permease [Candidatus Lachnoclostridium stercoravium]|uniref:ABC transporter permease n=1 Tax=Candidatus Lachnoclostridium stercoravium TaxID=2838633 RepID=A0A9D2KN65_9FIRM|nr:ABC transporter permease [Candidatus Lachnoclostridium stercoravium]
MTFDAKTIAMLLEGIWDTLYMVIISSGVSYLLGIPLGILLVVTDEDGIKPFPVFQKILGLIINLLRSVPFIILLLLMLPVTRMIVGTLIGSKAVIPPLVVSATPYIARMVESSFREVDAGVIEAAKSMGATTGQIVWKVLLPEAKPSLLVGAAISITTILGYTTMAGFVGGGGLGAIAINNGYYRYELGIMIVTVVLLIVIVQIIQEIFMRISKATDRRSR